MIDGTYNIEESFKDDYNDILRVYNYGTKKEVQKLYPKMDRAIKKASIGIQKHSMVFGGEEKIKWVRESYLLMGKAHFLKHDFISARRVFDYVAKEYADKPISFEGYLWLAKTHIETERFEKAEATLNLIRSKLDEGNVPKSVLRDLPLVQADFYIATSKYDNAYPYLERAIEIGNKRDLIIRAYFILAQINQRDGDLELATTYYDKVIKRNPFYIMDFEARINMAQCYDEGTGDSKNINKVLQKMVKDFKNKEFLDQIYYALADVAMKDGDIEKGIEYLRLSVSKSTTDNYQKSTSALELADIYFERNEYTDAQAYYDTAVNFLPADYPNFNIIKNKANVLSEMIVHSQTISLQDSLQKLASMDTVELYALIDGVIENYIKEKERKQEEMEAGLSDQGGVQFVDMNQGGTRRQSLGGKWYFYNTQALSMGRSGFIQKWGNRKLEDYWRLTDKRGLLVSTDDDTLEDEDVDSEIDGEPAEAKPTDPESRDYYLVNIPRTEEELRASDTLIIGAYNKLGFLYLEELNDTVNALDTYLTFQKKYPDNKYRLESWYALYKIYNETNKTEQAAQYKNLIIANYPESDYAKVILDPDFYIKQAQEKNQAAKLYEKAYDAFEKNQYYRVITYADRGILNYPDDTAYVPRFMYLRAISIGKVDVPDSLYRALDELIVSYPASPVVPMAQSILRLLQLEYGIGVTEEMREELLEGEEVIPSPFTYQSDAKHLFMMIINSAVEVDPLKVRISDFKKKYFRLERLNIKSLLLDNQRTLITIGNFENKDKADNFYSALKNDEYVLSGMDPTAYEIYTISMNNYPVFYRDKDVKAYREFFKRYYSNFEE